MNAGGPIHVIGVSHGMADHTAGILADADIIIGSPRQLAGLPSVAARQLPYPSPFSQLKSLLKQHEHEQVVLLASGDPLFHGIGGWLQSHYPQRPVVYHPHLSSVQLMFARLGKTWHHATVVNLHGRPFALLRRHLARATTLAILTDETNTPQRIAAEVIRCGFEQSRVYIGEHLGEEGETVTDLDAGELLSRENSFAQPNVVVVELAGPGGVLPAFPGIEDRLFETEENNGQGMISKREVRLQILSLLGGRRGQTGWDIGAGCGGVAVEWALWQPNMHIHAVEKNQTRCRLMEQNRDKFGVVDNLRIYHDEAPAVYPRLPRPDCIFIGGHGDDMDAVLTAAWDTLAAGGRMVISVLTEESRACLQRFCLDKTAQWLEVHYRRSRPLGHRHTLAPLLPVLLVSVDKP